MATSVVMPKMGESISEGTILRWLKNEGDTIAKDEPILEISTDKVDTEVPSPQAGVLLRKLAAENETVSVGTPIAEIGQAGESASAAPTQAAPTQAAPAQAAPAQQAPTRQEPAATPQALPAQQSAPAQQAAPATGSGGAEQEVVMPKMGESIAEGTVLRWLKKEGDAIKKDEPILEISTDKVDTEVPAPQSGTLTRILAQEGETVAVGAPIARISTGASAGIRASAPQTPAPQQPAAAHATESVANVAGSSGVASSGANYAGQGSSNGNGQTVAAHAPITRGTGARFYSPLVRTIASREGVSQQELDVILGSGLEGRVTKSDLNRYLTNRTAAPQQQPGAQPAQPSYTSVPSQTVTAPAPQRAAAPQFTEAQTIIPMDNIRQKIAEHMVRSSLTSAHVTSLTEVDVTNIVNFRNAHKDEFKRREGVNLTYTPIFIEAMVKAIKEFPFINASIDGTNIIVKRDINFGVAVSLPQQEGSPLPPALIVPVIKRAEDLNFIGLARAVADLANRARTKKLMPDDISGGTFTLTNPGMYGNLIGTPIINQPQLAIMTTGAIVKRVVVKTDESGNDYMAIRSMMFLGLSYDHRLIDGMYAVQFTDRVRQLMESFSGQM